MLPDLISTVRLRTLTPAEISDATQELLSASVGDSLKADFLRAWATRGETAEEVAACTETFLPLARDPGLRGSLNGKPLLDCCGTGGGGLNLLNISTGLMFILAAMGVPVVKHGNRGITKRSGSADVLEAMGIKIDVAPEKIPQCLDDVGCAFLFAPFYHTTFAAIAPVRKALAAEGQRTIFNLIAPLLNPARPDARLIGVFKQEHLDLYQSALDKMGCPRFTIAYGEDAESQKIIGEVSAMGTTRFNGTLQLDGKPLTHLTRTSAFHEKIDSLLVRTAGESAARLETIFSGEEQELERETLLINAAVASCMHGTSKSLEEGLSQGAEALDSGKALDVLRRWQKFSEEN
jgi:anthranilate phosphoribosyltransferase